MVDGIYYPPFTVYCLPNTMRRLSFISLGLVTLLAACSTSQDAKRDRDTERKQLQMAEQMRKSGDPARAAALLEQAVDKYPDDPVLLSPLGYTLIEAGQPEEAVAVFDRLIAVQPDNANAYNGKAVAFDHSGNHLAAQDLYQQALSLSPHSLTIRNNLGMSLILNGQLDKAVALFETLNDEESHNKTVRQNLALAYGLSGNKAKALALNLQDLPEAQAHENMHFYEDYANRMQRQGGKLSSMPVGFAETPPSIADKDEPVEPAVEKKVAEKKIAEKKVTEKKAAKKKVTPLAEPQATTDEVLSENPASKPAPEQPVSHSDEGSSYPTVRSPIHY